MYNDYKIAIARGIKYSQFDQYLCVTSDWIEEKLALEQYTLYLVEI